MAGVWTYIYIYIYICLHYSLEESAPKCSVSLRTRHNVIINAEQTRKMDHQKPTGPGGRGGGNGREQEGGGGSTGHTPNTALKEVCRKRLFGVC